MDDNTKIVGQNTPPAVQTGQAQPQATVAPISPVGLPNKELGPAAAPISEFVKPSETQPQIDQDLADLGIEAKKDEPSLTEEHKDLVDHAGPHVPVSTAPANSTQYPMSEEETGEQLKTGQDDDSGTGLAKLINKVRKGLRILGF